MLDDDLRLAELARRFFREVWNERNEESLRELLSPNFTIYGLTDEPLDLQGFVHAWREFHETLRDMHFEIEDMVLASPKAAVRLSISGIHVGAGFGIPPTGKHIQFGAQVMGSWDGVRVTEAWNIVDMAAAFRQLTG